MGIISDIIGGFSSTAQQSQANNAANQDTSALNQVYGTEQGLINNIAQQYYGAGGGASTLNGLTSFLQGNLGQTYSSPYTSATSTTASGLANGGMNSATNPYAGSTATSAGQLQNFNGLKPQELAALQQSTGAAGQSDINTMRSQMGGTANPNALIQSLMGQNQQNALNSGIQLGSQAAGQELSAQQSAGSLFSGLSGQNIGAQEAGGSLQSGLSSQNLDYLGQMIQGLLGTTSQQSGLISSGIGGLNTMGQTYQNAASGAANTALQDGQNAMNDFGGAANGIAGLFTGGLGGSSGADIGNAGIGGW